MASSLIIRHGKTVEIEIDGREMTDVRSYKLEDSAEGVATLTLEIAIVGCIAVRY